MPPLKPLSQLVEMLDAEALIFVADDLSISAIVVLKTSDTEEFCAQLLARQSDKIRAEWARYQRDARATLQAQALVRRGLVTEAEIETFIWSHVEVVTLKQPWPGPYNPGWHRIPLFEIDKLRLQIVPQKEP